ncbi:MULTISPECIES: LppU/SCO3897 family protein [Amycolatopsis]|uniref:Uncharacterized protein n=2 Tax=Amycolatopsis TaxID=1813 RepID=A0A1I4D961_9PSEU|nr:hypothetical protein [Amycolatopsis sacchari]SFK90022.1 hypothetical protein SAMN05421835_14316 [Amycolatopsis sacchari]
MGYPPAPGAFGPPPGVPVEPRKRSKLFWLRFAIPVVVLVVAALGVFGVFKSDVDRAAVGDCLNVKEFKDRVEPAKVDCGDQAANVKVGVRLDDDNASCPAGDYDEYSVSGRGSYKLCLMLNAREGECLANFSSLTQGYKRVNCGDPAAEVKIVRVADGKADDSACQGTDARAAITYSQPATTVCLAESTPA